MVPQAYHAWKYNTFLLCAETLPARLALLFKHCFSPATCRVANVILRKHVSCAWLMAPTLPAVPPLLKERRETRRPPIGLVQGSAVYSSWQSLEIWCVDDVVLMIPGSLRWSQDQMAQKMHSMSENVITIVFSLSISRHTIIYSHVAFVLRALMTQMRNLWFKHD